MIDARRMEFYDRYVCNMIVEKYGLDDMKAIHSFVLSETYNMLKDEELEICKLSPRIVFDMWENEKITGDPRNSIYIRGEY